MKRASIFLFFLNPFLCYALIQFPVSIPKNAKQVIVHFTRNPVNQKEHTTWNAIIHKSLEYINHQFKNNTAKMPAYSSQYPKKKNRAFFVRADDDLGYYVVHVPDGITQDTLVKQLQVFFEQNGAYFHIDSDATVHIAKTDIGLEGQSLTFDQLESLKKGSLLEQKQQELETKQKKEQDISSLKESIATLDKMKKALDWHQTFPTTGLRLEKPFYPPPYPFIPHFFSLWQWAPKKGKDITIAVLDTGVAAFQVEEFPAYRKNRDLLQKMPHGEHNFNIVSDDGLDPIEQLILFIKQYIKPEQFDMHELETNLPSWIKGYLQNNDVKPITAYIIKKGKKELVSGNALTQEGKKAVAEITTGRYGIEPKESTERPFTLATQTKPQKETVILELLPMGRISKQKTTFVAGHGSHTFGLINAQLTGDGTPGNDTGVLGLAPNANTFMIKAFNDKGISNKSTLIAAIKKALMHDADIVNLSLKIADNLDLTEQSSQLLERIVNLVPYMVAVSGNNGDPSMPRYAGEVEAYPARFASVPFDVGAFAYKDGKAFIPPFSQYEPGIGPLFVAPGFDILSSGLVPDQQVDSEYVFMGGTSMAAPIMSGFVALMLAEFKDTFNREQLLKVCYKSALKLDTTKDWQKKVILGVLDMRMALCILHALSHFKEALKERSFKFNFDKKFDNILDAIAHILFAQPKAYAEKYLDNVDFQSNFMTYFNKSLEQKDTLSQKGFFIPESINQALDYITNTLFAALGQKNIGNPKAPESVIKETAVILKKRNINFFGTYSEVIQKRLQAKDKLDPYWQKKIKELKERIAKGKKI